MICQAMCYLKLKEYKKTKASCDSALEINTSVKALCVPIILPDM